MTSPSSESDIASMGGPVDLHEVQRPPSRPADYVRPENLEEAMDLLAEHGDGARIVAGGTDLLVELDRGSRPDLELLIDISGLEGLDSIHQSRHGIHLGPLVTHNQCVVSDLVRERALPLAQACWEIGSPALRNRATVVGNIVTASPANDSLSALVALDAEVSMASVRGLRTVPIGEFTTGVRSTVLAPDEIVTGVTIPVPDVDGDRRGVYLKLGLRRAQAISVVHIAVVVTVDRDGLISDSRVVLGSVAPTVGRCRGGRSRARRNVDRRWCDRWGSARAYCRGCGGIGVSDRRPPGNRRLPHRPDRGDGPPRPRRAGGRSSGRGLSGVAADDRRTIGCVAGGGRHVDS